MEAKKTMKDLNLKKPSVKDTQALMNKFFAEYKFNMLINGQLQAELRSFSEFEEKPIPATDIEGWAAHGDYVTKSVCAMGRAHTENAARISIDKAPIALGGPSALSSLQNKTAVANIAHISVALKKWNSNDEKLREQMDCLALKAAQAWNERPSILKILLACGAYLLVTIVCSFISCYTA